MIPYIAPLLLLMTSASVPHWAAGPVMFASAAEGGDFVVYETGPGDTLIALAEAHFRDPALWRNARAANARLLASVDPMRPLSPGMRLRLDTAWLRRTPAKAAVTSFRGDVRVHAGGTTRPAQIGLLVGEGEGVETGTAGFVTLRLPDGSEISLPTSSAIRFDRLRRYSLNGALDRRIRLISGGTSARVVPLADPTSRHEVTTPVGVAAVRGTAFRVRYTPGAARASAGVLEGRVGVTAGAAPERLLPAGTGLVFSAAGPGAVTPLPAPPVPLDMPALQAGATARFAVRPEAGRTFRAIVATDPEMRDPLAEIESANGRFAISGLASGRYHLVVTAVTAEGLEGMPAHFSFDISERAAAASGGGADLASPGNGEPGAGQESAGRREAGGLEEAFAGLVQPAPVAQVLSGGLLEEGDTAAGLELAAAGGGNPPLWSLGPGLAAQKLPAVPLWGGLGSGFGRAIALTLPAAPPASSTPRLLEPGPLLPVPGGVVPPVHTDPGSPLPVPPSLPPGLPGRAPALALVPEPATWALVITGFGMIGLGLRARRAQRAANGRRAGAP
ncbi:FecR domain-containing protein [Thermaurantiacus sp.]